MALKEFDLWEELLNSQEIDEMGMLDLVYLEEILNQSRAERKVI
jgi:hypothetical protein